MTGHVYFIGAGPGDPDLITVKGQRLIATADVILYADSLVCAAVLTPVKPGAEVIGTSALPLRDIAERMIAAARKGQQVARVHSGDPSMYGAIHEQIAILLQADIPYTIVPGVSSPFAAAATLGLELTVPDVSQTVVFTRYAHRTTQPQTESITKAAQAGGTLVLFLSATVVDKVVAELLQAGLDLSTPAVIAYRVSWDDELLIRCTLADLTARVRSSQITRQALLLIGPALDPALQRSGHRSHLYREDYSHLFRKGQKAESGGRPS